MQLTIINFYNRSNSIDDECPSHASYIGTYICTYVQSIKENCHHSAILHIWIGGDSLRSNRAKLILTVKFKVESFFHSIVLFLSRGKAKDSMETIGRITPPFSWTKIFRSRLFVIGVGK